MRRAAARRAAGLAVAIWVGLVSDAVAAEQLPLFSGPVVDAANIVPFEVKQRVGDALLDYQQRSGHQIAVAVVDTTGSTPVARYAADLAGAWGVNGVVLVVVAGDRTASLAVGPLFSGVLTPAVADVIVARLVLPRVRENDVSGAVEVGADAVRRAFGDTSASAPPVTLAASAIPRHRSGSGTAVPVVLLLLVLAALGALVQWQRRRWGLDRPTTWGSGWGGAGPGRSRPTVAWRRNRRVRDAMHAAEAETGLLLCAYLGPVPGDSAVFAGQLLASAHGHPAALVLVDSRRRQSEIVVAPWAAARVPVETCADVRALIAAAVDAGAFADALVAAAGRLGARTATPSLGGVRAPEP